MMRRKAKFTLAALGVVALASLWPVTTQVSGHTKITIRSEGDAPLAGVTIRQWWDVYGWGGFRGKASSTTDADGTVIFPPRQTTGLLGVRLFNRAGALVAQSTSFLLFGKCGWGYTERWGPIVGIDVELPPGGWLPLETRSDGEMRSIIHLSDGPHRYIDLQNIDVDHSKAYISGDALGFLGDTEVILRLRPASKDEANAILNDPRRKELLKILPKTE